MRVPIPVLLLPVCLILLTALPAAASSRITCFLDGARVEREVEAVQGRVEMEIPPGVEIESLRVKPLHGAVITRVDFVSPRPDRKGEREAARLAERRDTLADRLKALEVKEEVLRAAAKSQSSKSPRPTKGNGNPLETIRKGTDFAFSRLEEVFRAQRQTEKEIRSLDARIAELNGAAHDRRRLVRVALAGKKGRVTVSYRDPGLKWVPSYDFRLHDRGEVEITLYAQLPPARKGEMVSVAPGLYTESSAPIPGSIPSDGTARVALLRFPLEREDFSPLPVSTVSFSFINRSERKLPPGESTCYRRGEYIGKARFEGSLPGETKKLAFGNLPPVSR